MWRGGCTVSVVDAGVAGDTGVVRGRPAVVDDVSLGVLVTAVDRDAIDGAVAACGAGVRRAGGKLPPHVTAYLTMGLCLFADDDYEEVRDQGHRVVGPVGVLGCVVDRADGQRHHPGRKRLGSAVMAEVFEGVAQPVAAMSSRGSWLRRWRLLAIDGFDVDVPDTPANVEEFGYAGSGINRSAYPKARVVALAECGTHAFLAAEVDAYAVGEKTLANRLYPRLNRDELLTADRNFYSFQAWGLAASTGAALLWRAPTQLGLPVVKILPDGTYLSVLIDPKVRSAARRDAIIHAASNGEDVDPDQAHLVRVIEYNVADREGNGTGEVIVLLTTILDPDEAGAEELADVYHQRWEEETANDQLKTHLRGPGRILRSRLPDLARQEIWAWLIVHYAIAVLISRAAEAADLDPDRISYIRTLRLIRRTATGTADFSP